MIHDDIHLGHEIVTCGKTRDGDSRVVIIQDGDPTGKHVLIVDDLVQVWKDSRYDIEYPNVTLDYSLEGRYMNVGWHWKKLARNQVLILW